MLSRLLSVDDSGEVLAWERVSLPLLHRLLRKERSAAAASAAAAQSGEAPDESSMDSTDLAHSTPSLPLLTRFHCVGRIRILSSIPTPLSSVAPLAVTPSVDPSSSASSSSSSCSPSLASLLQSPTVRMTTACWGLDDSLIFSSSSDGLVRAWQTPHKGRADELFQALYKRQRKAGQKARAKRPTDPSLSSLPVSLSLTRRSFFFNVPLLSPFATFAFHTHTDIPVIRVHPTLPSVFMSAGHDGLLCLWDVERRTLLRAFRSPANHRWIDGAFSPQGDLIALTGEEGHLGLFGLGSRIPYSQAPTEQFLKEDYLPLVRDQWGYVVDAETQLPPHLIGQVARILIRADGTPYDPQPIIDAVADGGIPRTDPQSAVDAVAAVGVGVGRPSVGLSLTLDGVLDVDLRRVARLSMVRLQRRVQWQHSHRSANDMATLAAKYRSRIEAAQQPLVIDEADEKKEATEGAAPVSSLSPPASAAADEVGWWNERPTDSGESHDVERDVAEEDMALDKLDVDISSYTPYEGGIRPSPMSGGEEKQEEGRVRESRVRPEGDEWVRVQRLMEEELALMETEEDRRDEDFVPPSPAVPRSIDLTESPVDSVAAALRASRAEGRARRRTELQFNESASLAAVDEEDLPLVRRAELRRSARSTAQTHGRVRHSTRRSRAGEREPSTRVLYKEDDWEVLDEEGEEREDEAGQEWHEEEEEGEEEEESEEEEEDSHPRRERPKADEGGDDGRVDRAVRRSERVGRKRLMRPTRRSESPSPMKGTRRSMRKRRRNSYREVEEDEAEGYTSASMQGLLLEEGFPSMKEERKDGESEWEEEHSATTSSFPPTLRTYHQDGDAYRIVGWGQRMGDAGEVQLLEPPIDTDGEGQDGTSVEPSTAKVEGREGVGKYTAPLVIRVRRMVREEQNGVVVEEEEGMKAGKEERRGEVAKPMWRWLNWSYSGKRLYRMRIVTGGEGEGAERSDEAEESEAEAGEKEVAMEAVTEEPLSEPPSAMQLDEVLEQSSALAVEVQ